MVIIRLRVEISKHRDPYDSRLEAMRSWIMRVEHKMDRNKVYIVHGRLMDSDILVVPTLKAVHVSGYECFSWKSPLVKTLLV
jgi:hypothetical protein